MIPKNQVDFFIQYKKISDTNMSMYLEDLIWIFNFLSHKAQLLKLGSILTRRLNSWIFINEQNISYVRRWSQRWLFALPHELFSQLENFNRQLSMPFLTWFRSQVQSTKLIASIEWICYDILASMKVNYAWRDRKSEDIRYLRWSSIPCMEASEKLTACINIEWSEQGYIFF